MYRNKQVEQVALDLARELKGKTWENYESQISLSP